jgi:hypothetical protein
MNVIYQDVQKIPAFKAATAGKFFGHNHNLKGF